MDDPKRLSPGEPCLVKALLAASKGSGAGYVHNYEGVPGWFVGFVPPRTDVYYRIIANRIYVRTRDDNEALCALIVDGKIVPQGSPDDLKPAGGQAPRRRQRAL